jgi:phage terminase Nu1 subunit (DNA packaging protein)
MPDEVMILVPRSLMLRLHSFLYNKPWWAVMTSQRQKTAERKYDEALRSDYLDEVHKAIEHGDDLNEIKRVEANADRAYAEAQAMAKEMAEANEPKKDN